MNAKLLWTKPVTTRFHFKLAGGKLVEVIEPAAVAGAWRNRAPRAAHPETRKGELAMRKPLILALLTTLAVGTPYVIAQTAPKTAGKPAATAPADMNKQMAQMQENMKRMQQQMDKIRQTKDPKERQKLMQEHMQSMQEGMNMMRGMGGPMMMGMMGGKPGAMGPGMMGGGQMGPGMMGGDPKQQQDFMQRRMDMMQMMMEQMMQHQQMMQPAPAK